MLGKKIRELRNEKKLTLKELGELLNLGESTMSMYENGKRSPDYNTLIKLADFFDVSIDYLLGRTDVNMNKFRPNPEVTRHSVEKYIESYEELASWLPEEEKDRLILFSNPMLDRIQRLSKESKKSLLEYVKLLELKDAQRKNQEQNDTETHEK